METVIQIPCRQSAPENSRVQVQMRWLKRNDIPRVLQIDSECFDIPWNKQDFLYCLYHCDSSGCMIAEVSTQEVVGFVAYYLLPSIQTIRIENFAVACEFQRRKVGSQIVDRLKLKPTPSRCTSISLKVRETNLIAQQFFRSQGFRAVTTLHNSYDTTDEDAYGMVYALPVWRGRNRISRWLR